MRSEQTPYVEELLMEGEQEYDSASPSLQEIEDALGRLDGGRFHTLTLTGPDGHVQLGISMGDNGRTMINWHDWRATDSWVVVDRDALPHAKVRLQDAEYPARQFVDAALAVTAARAFFNDGTRASGLDWTSLD
jgi:hypothetical protein